MQVFTTFLISDCQVFLEEFDGLLKKYCPQLNVFNVEKEELIALDSKDEVDKSIVILDADTFGDEEFFHFRHCK